MSSSSPATVPASGSPSRCQRAVIGLIAAGALALTLSPSGTANAATVPATVPMTVNLGSSVNFSVLAAAAATIPGSVLPGEVGAGSAITDDANTRYGSTRHAVNDTATRTALSDAVNTYTNLAALKTTGTLTGDDLAGQTVTPGVYHRVAAYAMTTPVTFDAQGDPNAYFIMQGDAALNTTAGTTVNLVNGAQASHIFWVLNGAATLGASSTFDGTILAAAAITVGATSHVNGRALSINAAVTLDADIFGPIATVVTAAPAVSINGGAAALTKTATPKITGTTDAPVGTTVTVTIGSDTETTTATANHTWTVTAKTAQPDGAITVLASVTVSGKTGTAQQTLTVDTTAPIITINGGPTATTSNSKPVIAGTTDAPLGSKITVTVAGQTLTTKVVANGMWNVTPGFAISNAKVTIVATVSDLAGNIGRATQTLTVANPSGNC